MTQPRVLLVDDNVLILEAARRILRPSCAVVGTVMSGGKLLQAVTALQPDVVVLDLSMPGCAGLDACRQIKRARPQVKVVILTAAVDAEIAAQATTLGASAYVLKHLMARDLAGAIQDAWIQ